ncbi:MAG: rhodanese-like domain-containing protein [Phycisphaerae bacterium]|nr:rhodanese-like domain-containing protein [Phycisphaerae bacterium]
MKTISRDELRLLLKSSEDYLLINVLGFSHFQDKHIPGSVNIPVDDAEFVNRVEGKVGSKARKIVVYCGSSECPASTIAAKKLDEVGFTNVHTYLGGVVDWEKAGLPLERAMAAATV